MKRKKSRQSEIKERVELGYGDSVHIRVGLAGDKKLNRRGGEKVRCRYGVRINLELAIKN